MTTVLLVDDHAAVRKGVATSLFEAGFDVVGEAGSISEGMAAIAHRNPESVVLDLSLPDGSGLELINWLRSNSQKIAIVVLTMLDNPNQLQAVMKSGASALVLKSRPLSDLVAALHHAIALPLHFSAANVAGLLETSSSESGLSPRELQVLADLPSALTASEIGAKIFISEATVKTHIAAIYRKLAVAKRSEAVAKAIKLGLLK
jgi:DNA-binding NarL/FixJ family response regulator